MKNALNSLVKALIIVGMIVGLLLIAWVVWYVATGPRVINGGPLWYGGMIAVFCVMLAEYIAFVLFGMMNTLKNDPFVTANVSALRRMGFAALAIAALGLSTLLVTPVPLAVVAALPIGMCGLFSLVLAQVFEKAVAFKLENDLTV